ncbi:MAG: hypothetical protein ACOYLE_09405 [Bacteroidales bacterium]
MKKLIVTISLMTFVLFVYTTNANNVKQDKTKAAVTVTEKATKDGAHKCCAGDKKADAKCCKGDAKACKGDAKACKGDAKACKGDAKKDAKCEPKAGCSKTCGGAKK